MVKLRKTLCVTDFGAIGDGVHDDTEAFERAHANGSQLKIRPGKYLLTKPDRHFVIVE